MRQTKKRPSRLRLTLLFTLLVFLILTATMLVVGAVFYGLYHLGVLEPLLVSKARFPILLLPFALASIAVGTVLSFMLSRIPLKPFHIMVDGLNRLAGGDYKTRIHLGESRIGKSLSESFNLLAGELENTEMLRSDFINGFSHEFKTPIVSILGFAKLLRRGNVPEEEQREYLAIIEEESSRLADMATNVLNLTKIENQSILTDVTSFDLSEQIRTCVLLLEKKWTRKQLQITADFQEYEVSANEELLKQVWINLLDNAIKFSPEGGEVAITIERRSDAVAVSIRNTGPEISEADRTRIFQKFYQSDRSHSQEGNGLGLSIVRRIVELHRGSVLVSSQNGENTFTVTLPD